MVAMSLFLSGGNPRDLFSYACTGQRHAEDGTERNNTRNGLYVKGLIKCM